MVAEGKFPKFDCLITGRQEEYDTDIAKYFITQDYLASEISELRAVDSDWAENYSKILGYLKTLEQVVINGGVPPSYKFLIDLSMSDVLEDDSYERLSRSSGIKTSRAYRSVVLVRELMYWFRKLSRESEFSERFTPEVFKGLPFLRLALSYRSVELSKL